MNQDTNDPYAAVEHEMGFGGDEPTTFLRLKNDGDTEVVILQGMETKDATQNERRKGYDKNGKTVEYQFVSPLTGNERTHRTSGQALMIGLKNATSFERDAAGFQVVRKAMPGEPIRIVRTGQGGDTRLNVTILSQEELDEYVKEHSTAGAPNSDEPSNTINPVQKPASTTASDPDEPVEPMASTDEQEQVNIDDIPF